MSFVNARRQPSSRRIKSARWSSGKASIPVFWMHQHRQTLGFFCADPSRSLKICTNDTASRRGVNFGRC